MPIARIIRAAAGGNPDGSGGARRRIAEQRRGVLGAVRWHGRRRVPASSSAEGPSAPDSSERISSKPASTKCSASSNPSLGGEPAPAGEHGAAHQPGGPDVAEDTALVADPVRQPRLPEQLVELRPMLFGNLARTSAMRFSTSELLHVSLAHRDTDRAQQHVGQLERAGLDDVEAVEQPVADEIEVAGHRPARVPSRASAAPRARGPGSSSESSSCRARHPARSRRSAARARRRRRPRRGRTPRIRSSSSDGGKAGPVSTWARKSPVGTTAAAV